MVRGLEVRENLSPPTVLVETLEIALPRHAPGRWIAVATWAYALVILGIALVLHLLGDRWWLATLLLYGPRWLCGLPLILLVPLAAWMRRRCLIVLGGTACVLIGPVMGMCIPWSTLGPVASGGPRLRILTFNLQKNHVHSRALESFIEQIQPDVLVFQEWGGQWGPRWGGLPSRVALQRKGWHVRTKEALVIASRYPIVGESTIRNSDVSGQFPRIKKSLCFACDLKTPDGIVKIFNFHGSTPRVGIEAIIARGWRGAPALTANSAMRQAESEAVSDWTRRSDAPAIVVGDFNLPIESAIYKRNWSMYRDAFSQAGWGFGETKFESLFGARIDHILVNGDWQVRRCWVGPDFLSDHRPVIADLSRSKKSIQK